MTIRGSQSFLKISRPVRPATWNIFVGGMDQRQTAKSSKSRENREDRTRSQNRLLVLTSRACRSFLSGHARGEPLETCLKRGAIAAAEVISHYGPRPEADTQSLMAERLA